MFSGRGRGRVLTNLPKNNMNKAKQKREGISFPPLVLGPRVENDSSISPGIFEYPSWSPSIVLLAGVMLWSMYRSFVLSVCIKVSPLTGILYKRGE
jgi:hypothetical protein